MARGMVGSISNMLEGIYGVAERAEEVSADPRLLGAAIGIGIITSMIAAWLPARSASRVDPVQALQKGKYQVLTAGENRARRLTAAVVMAMALVMLWVGTSIWFYAGYVLIIVAALLLVPTVALWLSRMLRPVLKWLRPVEGALAADSLIQSPRRTSGAVAALMLSLGQVIGIGGIGRESYNSIVDWLNTALNPDLFVAGSQNLSDRTFRFPKTLGDVHRRHSRRRRFSDREELSTERRRNTRHAHRDRRRKLRASRAPPAGGRRPAGHVSAGEGGRGRHRL